MLRIISIYFTQWYIRRTVEKVNKYNQETHQGEIDIKNFFHPLKYNLLF